MKSASDAQRPGAARVSRALAAVVGCLAACAEYVEPPEVDLVAPPTGTFFVGDAVELRFSMPIEPESFALRVWSDQRDIELVLLADAPLLDNCRPGACAEHTLSLAPDARGATLVLDPSTLGKPDVPYLLEVVPGLRGANGAVRRYTEYFDFQFKPAEVDDTPVEFDEGHHIIVAVLEQPLPAIINLICDFRRGPGNRVAALGAEGDPVAGAPENTGEPDQLRVDDSAQGYVIFAHATLRESADGTRFFESEPFDINLRFGGIRAVVGGTRFTGAVSIDAETERQRIDGTMSFETFRIDVDGAEPYEYPPGSTTFVARWFEDSEMPAGSPTICGDMCGAVTAQCEPPEGFPGDGYCG